MRALPVIVGHGKVERVNALNGLGVLLSQDFEDVEKDVLRGKQLFENAANCRFWKGALECALFSRTSDEGVRGDTIWPV